MKKSFVKLVSVSLAAATIATAAAPVVANAQTITMPSGNVYTKNTNTGNMTKAEAAAAITELMAYYASETAAANALQPKIEATQKDVTEAEANLSAKEKLQAEAQNTFEAAQKAAGTTATEDRYINRDYDSVKKEIQDKFDKAEKDAASTRDARIKAADDAVYEAQKVVTDAQSAVDTARENLRIASGVTTREVTTTEEVVITPAQPEQPEEREQVLDAQGNPVLNADGTPVTRVIKEAVPAVPAVTEMQEVTRTENVPAADQATIDGYKAEVQKAETALANANDALEKAKQNYASEVQAANSAYTSAVNNAEAARQQELRSAEYHFEKNDQYGEKSLKDAKVALDNAKSETSAARTALQKARQALVGFQNQFALHSANAELASYKAAEISLGKNIDVNKELGNVSADQIKVLNDLRAQGAEAIQQKADKAAGAKAAAEKALDELRKQNETATDPNANDQKGNKVAGANSSTSTPNRVAGEKKADDKKATLPETGENSSYAVFGAAALSVLAGLGLVAPKFRKED